MRWPRPISFLVLAVGATVACATATTTPPAPADDAGVRARSAAVMEAAAAKDAAAVATFYSADAYLLPPNAPMATGNAAIQRAWAEFLGYPNLKLSTTTRAVNFSSSNDMAVEVGTYNVSFDSPDGPVKDNGKYTAVWHNVGDQWVMTVDAWNSNNPMPEPPAPTVMADASDMGVMAASALQWGPLEIPGFKSGIKLAVIHGNPGEAGDYTIRLKFPDGYTFPSHWHPNGEHVTVVSGTFMLGMGPVTGATKTTTYKPGDFLYIPAKMPHFGGAKGETVIQLHGEGPFQVMLSSQS